jgi:cell division protein FtsW
MSEKAKENLLAALENARWDLWLAAATLGLVLFGVVMVYSASGVVAAERFGGAHHFLLRHVVWVVLGLGLMFVLMRVDYRHYANPAVVWGLLGASAVLLAAALFFPARNGAHRWITFGPFSAQPSELAKVAFVIFLARFLVRREEADEAGSFKLTLLPAGVIAGLLAALIMKEPDLGTTAMLGVIFVVMLFAGRAPVHHLLALVPVAAVAFYFFVVRVPFRMQRLRVFLDPTIDPQGAGYQVTQSLIGVGLGGVSGAGLAEGRQKMLFLPEAHADFIFAVVAEELGLVGAVALVLVFGLLLWRGVRISLHAGDRFGQLLAIGLTTMLIAQAFFNISVVLNLLPNKGIPLPFVSYGGSSLIFALAAVGILLNISEQGTEEPREGQA